MSQLRQDIEHELGEARRAHKASSQHYKDEDARTRKLSPADRVGSMDEAFAMFTATQNRLHRARKALQDLNREEAS